MCLKWYLCLWIVLFDDPFVSFLAAHIILRNFFQHQRSEESILFFYCIFKDYLALQYSFTGNTIVCIILIFVSIDIPRHFNIFSKTFMAALPSSYLWYLSWLLIPLLLEAIQNGRSYSLLHPVLLSILWLIVICCHLVCFFLYLILLPFFHCAPWFYSYSLQILSSSSIRGT